MKHASSQRQCMLQGAQTLLTLCRLSTSAAGARRRSTRGCASRLADASTAAANAAPLNQCRRCLFRMPEASDGMNSVSAVRAGFALLLGPSKRSAPLIFGSKSSLQSQNEPRALLSRLKTQRRQVPRVAAARRTPCARALAAVAPRSFCCCSVAWRPPALSRRAHSRRRQLQRWTTPHHLGRRRLMQHSRQR